MPDKSTGIKGRHPAEVRVEVKANFSGYLHPFGITVKRGEKYKLDHGIVNKYNKEMKTKEDKKPFEIIGKPEKCHDDSVGVNLGRTPELGKVNEPDGMKIGNMKAREKELEAREKAVKEREEELEKEGKKEKK